MQLRRGDTAGLAGLGDHLAAFDDVPLLDQHFARVSVSGDKSVAVAHQHQIAIALQLVAGIRDNAIFGRLDRCTLRHGEIDAVVL